MSSTLTCPEGHEWEDPFDGAGGPQFCPVCGALVEPSSSPEEDQTQHDQESSQEQVDTITIDPSEQSADAARAETHPALRESSMLVQVPGYDIINVLGKGGMGIVYRARQLSLGRLVALKMIKAGAHADWSELTRFKAEAEAAARLQHANIVQIHEIGEANNTPYFSMELVDGDSLADRLDGTPWPARDAASMVEPLARAVDFAHQRGIVHRDLKPANVILHRQGGVVTPKLTDFGLAKILDSDSGHTRTGEVLGTPSYMAPEQALGQRVGPRVDVYALGAIFYELLTGRAPFKGETPLDTLMLVRNEDPVPPRRLQPRIPVDAETICLKAMHRDPDKRYATGVEFADDIRRFLNGEPIHARPRSTFDRVFKWAMRRKALAALIAVVALAVVTLLTASLYFNVALDRAARRESAKAKEAEENLERALEAVETMLTQVAGKDLEYVPQMEVKRSQLLNKALALYERFLDDRQTTVRLQRHTAYAAQRVANINRELGKVDQAREAYRRAVSLLVPLAEDSKDVPEFRQRLAQCFNDQGQLEHMAGDPSDAQRSYERALEVQEHLVKDYPGEPKYRNELARTWYNLGIFFADREKYERSEDALAKSADLLEVLAKEHPEVPEYRQELARACINRGRTEELQKSFADAKAHCAQAVRLLEELATQYPNHPDYRKEWAIALTNLGNLFAALNDKDKAMQNYERASELQAQLSTDFPHMPIHRKELANTWNSKAAVLAGQGKPEEAAASWTKVAGIFRDLLKQHEDVHDFWGGLGLAEGNLAWVYLHELKNPAKAEEHAGLAIDALGKALAKNPDHPKHGDALINAHADRAEALFRRGAYAEGQKEVADLLAVRKSGDDEFLGASLFAQALGNARKDESLSEPEKGKLETTLTNLALASLRKAARKGCPLLKDVKTNRAFEPLYENGDFQAIAENKGEKK